MEGWGVIIRAGRVMLLAGLAGGAGYWLTWEPPAADKGPLLSDDAAAALEPVEPTSAPDYDAIVNSMLRESAEAELNAAPPPRQTVFNDRNYEARAPDNIMESAHVPRLPAASARRERPRAGLSGSGDARFEWVDARRKRSRWQTRYEYRNGVINNSSFCRNYRRGSIEYRTCRKGARAWLAERCGDGTRLASARQRMYCHAHSGFRL